MAVLKWPAVTLSYSAVSIFFPFRLIISLWNRMKSQGPNQVGTVNVEPL